MKEAIVRKDTSVEIVDSPIPKPGPGHVLIKVIVAGKWTFWRPVVSQSVFLDHFPLAWPAQAFVYHSYKFLAGS